MQDVKRILQDQGCGAADACSVNATFLNDQPRTFYNIEMGPGDKDQNITSMDIICGGPGKNLTHCNR